MWALVGAMATRGDVISVSFHHFLRLGVLLLLLTLACDMTVWVPTKPPMGEWCFLEWRR